MIISALLTFAVLVFLRPKLALAAVLFLIPFGHLVRFDVAGIPFTFPEIAAYALALVCAANSRKPIAGSENQRWLSAIGYRLSAAHRDPWILLPLLWILVAAVAAYGSPAGVRAWGIWKAYFVTPVLLFWTIRALRGQIEVMRHIITPLALGAFGIAALAIVQRWWPVGVSYPWSVPGQFRATSVFGYPNAVGLYLAPLIPIFAGFAASGMQNARHRLIPLLLFVTAVSAAVAIAFAKSTGALVALAVALPVFVILFCHDRTCVSERVARDGGPPDARRSFAYEQGWLATDPASAHGHGSHRRATWIALGIICAWLAASAVTTAWLPYIRDLERIRNPILRTLAFGDWSGSVRLEQYRETWALLRDHPIRGAGLSAYHAAVAPYHRNSRIEIFLYPHHILLAVWVELGLAGVIIFLAMLYQFFRSTIHYSLSILHSSVAIAMIATLIHGIVDVPYFKNDLAMLFWTLAAIAAMLNRSVWYD